VLHRDLKPANIMLGAYGETLIIDWGLAKAVGHRDPAGEGVEATLVPPSGDSHEPTVAGLVLGSPPYMSPEQAEGMLDQLGPATDVYGLGATLYALLTGRPPVAGPTAEVVLHKVRKGQIVPPRQVSASVPRPLEAICLKALALDPSARYSSARALAQDVEHWLADEPVSALRESFPDRARRWARRHRTLVTTGAAVLFLGLIGLSAFAAVIGDKNRRLVAANTAIRRAETLADARLDRAMSSIEDYFTGFSDEALKGGQLPSNLRDRLLARPRQFYEQLTAELAAKPDPSERERALLANGQYSLGRILRILGKGREARGQGEAAIAIYEALVALHPDVADYRNRLAMSLTLLGLVLAEAGGSDEAVATYKKAIAIREALVARRPDVPEYRNGLATIRNNLGLAFTNTGRIEEAADSYKEAIAIREALVARHPDVSEYQDGLASCNNNLGMIFASTGRPEDATVAFKKAITAYEGLAARYLNASEYRNGIARGRNNLGYILASTGRASEAADSYKEAIAIGEALVARQPNVLAYQDGLAGSHRNLGLLLKARGRFIDALAAFQRAAKVAPPGSSVAASLPGLIRDTENARAQADRLRAILKREAKPKDTAEGLAYAQLCYDQSRYAAAAWLWDNALAADPKIADDRRAGHRYNAACAAALAAAGKGKDEPPPDDDAKARLREQARAWLKAELAAWTEVLEKGPAQGNADVVRTLQHWQVDADLAAVRDPDALAKLPEAERNDWRKLWAGVGLLLGKARGGQP
jgi:eukaryotic-like serine/threonine-protein kinase